MQVKAHYDHHLGNFYSWMLGDLAPKVKAFAALLNQNGISPKASKVGIDLGAGNGIQSLALKQLGYQVTAIDFNTQLLNELKANPDGAGINVVNADILTIADYARIAPELIVCCGDTLTHLESKGQVERFIKDACQALSTEGYLVLTYRDYTNELTDQQRFIPVKSDSSRILTCILEYYKDKVKVTDLLHEHQGGEWVQQVSSYEKVRMAPDEVLAYLKSAQMEVVYNEAHRGMQTVIARK